MKQPVRWNLESKKIHTAVLYLCGIPETWIDTPFKILPASVRTTLIKAGVMEA